MKAKKCRKICPKPMETPEIKTPQIFFLATFLMQRSVNVSLGSHLISIYLHPWRRRQWQSCHDGRPIRSSPAAWQDHLDDRSGRQSVNFNNGHLVIHSFKDLFSTSSRKMLRDYKGSWTKMHKPSPAGECPPHIYRTSLEFIDVASLQFLESES